MNSGAAGAAAPPGLAGTAARATPAPRTAAQTAEPGPGWLERLRLAIAPRHVVVLAGVLLLPLVATPFLLFQVVAQSLVLGLIALSLTFLGGYGGMVSLAQMTVAGIAGYALAVLGQSSAAEISLGWPWWAALPTALLICTLCATLIGWLSVRPRASTRS
jgi:branched-chain amino acid transport system permease protein